MLQRFFFLIIILSVFVNAYAQNKQIIMHDPVAIEANNKYYLFGTGLGLESAVSEDMENWTKSSPVFDSIPEWFKKEVPRFNGHIWAPDIVFQNGKYYLYYSVSSFGSNLSSIGVATNTTLDTKNEEYKWKDHGPIINSVPGRDNWNAIDPNIVFDDNNVPWLSFGSFWGGLKIVKLNEDLISIAQPQEWHTIAARMRDFNLADTVAGNGAVEAPFIFKKDDYYYLFVSFDLCCRGAQSTYNVRVGRSESVTGPYVDKDGVPMTEGGGTLFIEGNDDYYAIGHNSVYLFDGEYYMFSHGYDVHDNGRPKLLVHILYWDKQGWPYIQ
ncbi:MAG: arabinan endo-1,5-alpha-L-arabinosidase [Bacteroidales bacterium]|jgi:arabinan endo-1,5-alpha-L-arabinosidase